jgi:hypothetical protein
VGKNGVMTVAHSLFGISWHKECWTKNKWPDFCPLGFSRFPRSPTAVAQFVSVCVSILPGFKWVFQGLEKIGRDAKKNNLGLEMVKRGSFGNSRMTIMRGA